MRPILISQVSLESLAQATEMDPGFVAFYKNFYSSPKAKSMFLGKFTSMSGEKLTPYYSTTQGQGKTHAMTKLYFINNIKHYQLS
jgi:hypothetical protein